MKLKKDYITYFENYINEIFQNAKKNIKIAVHDEFYYKNDESVNADFTLKFLPGQIQQGIAQYPAEIYMEIEDMYKDDVLDAVTTFIEGVNETVISLDNFNYKQFYTLPNVLSAFQNGLGNKMFSASVSMSLFEFKVCGFKSITIDNEEIGFINASMAYVAETNSTGGLNTSGESKSTGELCSRTLAFAYVPLVKDSMAATTKFMDLLFSATPNPNTGLTVNILNTISNTAFSASWLVKDCNISQEINGFPTIRVTLVMKA